LGSLRLDFFANVVQGICNDVRNRPPCLLIAGDRILEPKSRVRFASPYGRIGVLAAVPHGRTRSGAEQRVRRPSASWPQRRHVGIARQDQSPVTPNLTFGHLPQHARPVDLLVPPLRRFGVSARVLCRTEGTLIPTRGYEGDSTTSFLCWDESISSSREPELGRPRCPDSGSMDSMSWRAYLKGHPFDLDLLAEQFDRGQVVVRRDGDQGWMESPEFRDLTEPGDVQRVSGNLLSEMNGAAALVDASYRRVELTDQFSDGSGSNFVLLSGAFEARIRLTAEAEVRGVDGELVPPPPPPPTPGPEYLAIARREQNVREVLELLGGGPGDWATMYKIFEVIRDDGNHKRWGTKSEYSAFTASACLPSVSGPSARHARGGPKPQRTMTIHEGRAFIRRVALAWVLSK
jgi:hypothetical protein